MDYISSKNICLLVWETLKLLDKRPTETGERTAYIVYKMLQSMDLFEEFEMAELCCVAMLRDIGEYKTKNEKALRTFGFAEQMAHSIYGYLFMKYLFPVPAYGKILLYHHMDHEQMKGVSYEMEFMSDFIHLGDDISRQLFEEPDTFDYHTFEKDAETKYAKRTYQVFEKAENKYGILDALLHKDWKQELVELLDYILFRNDEKRKYLEMLMYCTGFQKEQNVVDTVTCICICQHLAGALKLEEENRRQLYYGTLLHDIGMLAIPEEILNAPRPLREKEREQMQRHVEIGEKLLRRYFTDQRVVDIAVRHHERMDGSGYPRGLRTQDMTLADEILQTADTVCALVNERSYHGIREKKEVNQILRREVLGERLNAKVVAAFLEHYDRIMSEVESQTARILTTYRRLQEQSEKALEQFLTLAK